MTVALHVFLGLTGFDRAKNGENSDQGHEKELASNANKNVRFHESTSSANNQQDASIKSKSITSATASLSTSNLDEESLKKKKNFFLKYSVKKDGGESSIDEQLDAAACSSEQQPVVKEVKPVVDAQRGMETWRRFKEMKKKNKNHAKTPKVNKLENCDFLAQFAVFT